MSTDQIANLFYLALLGSVLVFWVLVRNREGLNRTLQNAAIWALIFVGVIAAVGLWGDIRQASTFRASINAETGEVTVPRAPDGHYYLTVEVNDTPIRFVVDTGATDIVLTRRDAKAAGVDLDGTAFLGQARTANGTVRVASVTLNKLQIGPVVDRDVRASVSDGDMDTSLLGMTYLQRFERLEISRGRLVLSR